MKNSFLGSALYNEEMRATKLFIGLFLAINLSYDIVYYQILPKFMQVYAYDPSVSIISFFSYGLQLLMIFAAILLIKKKKIYTVKYLFFISYTIFNIIMEPILFDELTYSYAGGNIVEIFMVLFSPIFVNKRFFFTVASGTIIKYFIVGLLIHSNVVVIPIVLVVILSLISYLILHRFQGYVKAISDSYRSRFEGIVKGIIAALELKDPYTRGHSERVAYYALTLAQRLQKYNEDELEAFYYSCLLHDVGKVSLPDTILTKPGKLTPEEYEIVKQHPVVGSEAIKDIEKLPNSIDVIRYHHERWDGQGYPDGLEGEEIPLLARVVAIADAFDAMTSDRSYRKAISPEEAYNRILEAEGTQFDPELVQVFKEVYPIWVKLIDSYKQKKAMMEEKQL